MSSCRWSDWHERRISFVKGFYGERDGGHTLDFGVAHGRNTQMFSTVARMILCITKRSSVYCDYSTIDTL